MSFEKIKQTQFQIWIDDPKVEYKHAAENLQSKRQVFLVQIWAIIEVDIQTCWHVDIMIIKGMLTGVLTVTYDN